MRKQGISEYDGFWVEVVGVLGSLFEQVWAADDYNTFCTMMTQKNIELQLQALEMLQFKYGIVPESYKKGEEGEQEEDDPEKKERELLEEVYR
ncbi:Cilia- and flagella-associated protein 36 [Portunus trituberculatus]|uniref:Cilia- and flagella-associated protein 36 n=1 Tax=Portunus trituberculatus TaxID=210409 RepID=A0A5B7KLS7_PORTR|nr:Cilia- and flagella-associated protein 36 [Portunus trituberculatus]